MNLLAAIKREERKLERQLGKLQKQFDGLRAAAKVLGNRTSQGVTEVKRRVMSAAAKTKISKAAKARWAKFRAEKQTLRNSVVRGTKRVKKRVLSAAGRAKISKAAKARWAKVRAEKNKKR